MTQATLMQAMKDSISNVLETMFFLMVQINNGNGTLKEWFSQGQALLGATLSFDGPVAGYFYFLIPVDMADDITGNFLGLSPQEINEEQRKDTVKEALNMIGGGVLSLFDPKTPFKLGIPEIIAKSRIAHNKLQDLPGDFILIETVDNRLSAGIVLN